MIQVQQSSWGERSFLMFYSFVMLKWRSSPWMMHWAIYCCVLVTRTKYVNKRNSSTWSFCSQENPPAPGEACLSELESRIHDFLKVWSHDYYRMWVNCFSVSQWSQADLSPEAASLCCHSLLNMTNETVAAFHSPLLWGSDKSSDVTRKQSSAFPKEGDTQTPTELHWVDAMELCTLETALRGCLKHETQFQTETGSDWSQSVKSALNIWKRSFPPLTSHHLDPSLSQAFSAFCVFLITMNLSTQWQTNIIQCSYLTLPCARK